MKHLARISASVALSLCALFVSAQDANAPQVKNQSKAVATHQSPAQDKALQTLRGAKTIYLKHNGQSLPAFTQIQTKMQQWGKYTLVTKPEFADLIMEIDAPRSDAGFTTAGSTVTSPQSARAQQAPLDNLSPGGTGVHMLVYDTSTHSQLYKSYETYRFFDRQRTRQELVVDAADWLARRFRDFVDKGPTS